MSDTVKLIVTLSKGQYETLKNIQCGSIGSRMIVNAVMNGIPLDDVKAEIEKKTDVERIKQNLSELAQYNADMLKAFNAGKELAEKEKREWIPVSERLPEDSEWQLVSVMDYGENFSFALPRIARIETDGKWHFSTPMDDQYEYFLKVVAWQPIPEPYRKGEWNESI